MDIWEIEPTMMAKNNQKNLKPNYKVIRAREKADGEPGAYRTPESQTPARRLETIRNVVSSTTNIELELVKETIRLEHRVDYLERMWKKFAPALKKMLSEADSGLET